MLALIFATEAGVAMVAAAENEEAVAPLLLAAAAAVAGETVAITGV
jgi:hypothetical protein